MRKFRSGAVLTAVLGLPCATYGQLIGPSTTVAPHVLPSLGGVQTKSILTVGDNVGGYRMVGIPDGMGALDQGDGSFNLYVNHELGPTSGVARAHGATGAFVSRWNVDAATLGVNTGADHITSQYTWDYGTSSWSAGAAQVNRFCSADIPAATAFSWNGLGTSERILMHGEETRPPFSVDHGRAFGTVLTGPNSGQSWELPWLGRMSWENAVASPFGQEKTIVIGLDDADASTVPDTNPSELYVYVGTKTASGNEFDRAGLNNGTTYGVKVNVAGNTVTEESNSFGLGTNVGSYVGNSSFELANLGDASTKNGVQLQTDTIAADVMRMQRIEDGAFDPRPGHENDFYFVTTASFTGNSRLWKLSFSDIENPEAGGSLEILLEGDEGHKMLDNITIDSLGRILMQEDIGNQADLGKIWLYDIDSAGYTQVAQFNSDFFVSGASDFITQDEESSGIIDAESILGPGWFLLNSQAHAVNSDLELVEFGQLMAMYVNPNIVPEPASLLLLSLGALALVRRR